MKKKKKKGFTHAGDFAVDLGCVLAFRVRILRRSHLQDAHPKGVNVHRLVVLLLVHLRSHEFGSACQGERERECKTGEISMMCNGPSTGL